MSGMSKSRISNVQQLVEMLRYVEVPDMLYVINEELSYLNDCISDLQDRCVPLKNICIVARTNQLVKDYSSQLTKSGYSVYQIKRSKADDLSHDGTSIRRIWGTIFLMKLMKRMG